VRRRIISVEIGKGISKCRRGQKERRNKRRKVAKALKRRLEILPPDRACQGANKSDGHEQRISPTKVPHTRTKQPKMTLLKKTGARAAEELRQKKKKRLRAYGGFNGHRLHSTAATQGNRVRTKKTKTLPSHYRTTLLEVHSLSVARRRHEVSMHRSQRGR